MRRMHKSITRSLALMTVVPALCGAAEALVYGNVSAWTVRTDPAHGYRCFAEAGYGGGSFMRVGYASNDASALYLEIGDSAWRNVASGESYALTLQFDEKAVAAVDGVGLDSRDGFRISIPAAARKSFLEDFGHGYSISVARDGQDPVMLSLGGTLGATKMLGECQSSMPRLVEDY
jgi:hypothetical protein